MSRRSLTLAIAGVATVAAIAVAVLFPVPYVILTPGPTLNTLGKDSSGQPLISITGHPTYPTNGHLNLVTISYMGGPGVRLNIFQALRAWVSPSEAVVPETEIFPVWAERAADAGAGHAADGVLAGTGHRRRAE